MCVLAAGEWQRFHSALSGAGIPTSAIPAGTAVSARLLAGLGAEVRRFRPDIVHTHLIHADVQGQIMAKLLAVPGVSTVHGPQPFYRRQPARSAARLAARLAVRTIAISEYLASVVVEWGVVPPERVRVVPYGVDVGRWTQSAEGRQRARAELGVEDHQVAVGVASRLVAGKGHEVLIRAVASARTVEPSLVLVVAGDGPRRAPLEELAARLAPEAVRFVGYLPDVARLLAAVDVLVVPTQPELGEGFGLAALEAMAAARPVVVSDTASLPEVVADGVTGIVVPPHDVDAFGRALITLRDSELRRRLGEAGRARAAARFSLDEMVSKTLEVYAEATETPLRGWTAGRPG